MNRVSILAAALGILGASGAVSTHAGTVTTVIDFNDAPLGAVNQLLIGDFRILWPDWSGPLTVVDLGNGDHALADLWADPYGTGLFLSRIDGGLIAINSFDLIAATPDSGVFSAQVSYSDAGVWNTGYNWPGHYTIGNIANAEWVYFGLFDYGSGARLDNIEVSYEVPYNVPAPATMLLFGSGLLGLIGLRRGGEKG